MSGPKTKKCAKCEETKAVSEFYKNPRGTARYRCKVCDRGSVTKRVTYKKYGLSLGDRAELLRLQNCRCAICSDLLTPGQAGHAVDHDHATGAVRGLLCAPCNKGLGNFKDDRARLREAAAYLKRHGH